MGAPEMTNLIVEQFRGTYHICMRCVGSFARQEIKCFSKVGCQIIDLKGASLSIRAEFSAYKFLIAEEDNV